MLALAAALPAAAQEGVRIGDAVRAGVAVHRSVAAAEAVARSAQLALRLAEIDHGRIAVTVSATPAASVDLAPIESGTVGGVADTARGSGTVSAAVALPWGMEVSGSYTAEVDLGGSGRAGETLLDVYGLSLSQDLLPEGRLSASSVALVERRGQFRLARLRLARARNEAALEVARMFLTLIERATALTLARERLAVAERSLAHTESLVAQEAAERLDLLDATITAAGQRNAIDEMRAVLSLDTAGFLADLELPPQSLIVPDADLAALRASARSLLAEPIPPGAIGVALEVLEAEAALVDAELQAERAQRGALPELSLSVDYRKPRSTPRPGSLSLSVTGSYPLLDGGRSAVASEQALEQAATARRQLATTRTDVERAFARSRIELAGALAADELAALQLERARLRLAQAERRQRAGAISAAQLQQAALQLRDTEADVRAAALALADAYLAIATDLGLDLQNEIAAIIR